MIDVWYHDNCADGFCAAWIVANYYGIDNVRMTPVQYGRPMPSVEGITDLVIVDFSYPNEVLDTLPLIKIIDHHKTAEHVGRRPDGLFDIGRSGAGLTWDHFHPGEPRPAIVNYVEDRDLWRWALPHSKAYNAAIGLLDSDLVQWDVASRMSVAEMVSVGAPVMKYRKQVVKDAIKRATLITLNGLRVPCMNATMLISEICGELAIGHPFAVTWFFDGKQFVYSLRSTPDGADVSGIAKFYGGGGHKHAAGFVSKTFIV